jgi:hypothetical protein
MPSGPLDFPLPWFRHAAFRKSDHLNWLGFPTSLGGTHFEQAVIHEIRQ